MDKPVWHQLKHMRKLITVVHVSLDGYVANENGALDGFEPGDENLGFVCRITESADAALFGRISWELLDRYWPTAKDAPGASDNVVAYSNWYNHAHKIVCSRTLQQVKRDKVTLIADDIAGKLSAIKQQAGKDILVFGSPSITQFLLQDGLVDAFWIFINPVLFGKGIPLFAKDGVRKDLVCTSTQSFSNGEVAFYYEVQP